MYSKEKVTTEKTQQPVKKFHEKAASNISCSNTFYTFGIIAAAYYFLQHATTFWLGVIGIIKAIFWPVLIIYKILEMLKI